MGPARVVHAGEEGLRVELADDVAPAWGVAPMHARMATPIPYQPRRNDTVLVVGGPEALWVIGVLHGRSAARLAGRRVSIEATGKVTLSSSRAVRLRSTTVRVSGSKLRLVAERVHNRLSNWTRSVTDRLELHAGDLDQLLDRDWAAQAGRMRLEVKKRFYVNGRNVRLG